MDYRLDIGMWNRVFAVPCALVDKHLKLCAREQLMVLLYALRHAGEVFSPEELAGELGISEDQALDSLEYWCDRELLSQSGGTLLPLPQRTEAAAAAPAPSSPEPSPAPSPTPAAPSAEAGPSEKEPALPPKKRLIRPDGVHIAARINESESIRWLMQEAEAALGRTLSPAMSSLLVATVDDYGLPEEVTLMLLQYARDIGRTGTSYIDSVARDWAESGIFTLEAAEEKLKQLTKARLAWGKVTAAAGLSKRSPSKSEEERVCRWVYDWGFSQEMLEEAYGACANNTGKFSAAYMDKVLTGWHELGITNAAELKKHKQETAAKKTAESAGEKSYDIDELTELSSLRLPDKL